MDGLLDNRREYKKQIRDTINQLNIYQCISGLEEERDRAADVILISKRWL